MVNDLNDNCHTSAKISIKDSKPSSLTHVTDNPLEDLSNSHDQTKHTTNPTGIASPPPF